MNSQIKSVLLTVLTLSLFVIALVELSGVSSTALFNKYGIGKGGQGNHGITSKEETERNNKAKAMPKTMIEFPAPIYNFGKVKEGDVVTHAFRFKNKGNAPLFIVNAQASCGCTVPSFPKEPVAPGGEGEIVVKFDSHHRKGHQQKNVLITSNAQQERVSVGFEVDVE